VFSEVIKLGIVKVPSNGKC